MKEFHIINVGNSLLSNFKKANDSIKNIQFSEEEKWDAYLSDINFLNDIYNFILESPTRYSAEVNSFKRIVDGKDPKDISVYLFGTKTASNEICRVTIERYLKENRYNLYTPSQISGYFWEEKSYDSNYAKEQFSKDINTILDRILYLAKKKKEEGYEVYINPTGGFKPHVVASALAGFLTDCKVYYIHEEFQDVILMPKLFYLPKGKEIELLGILRDKKPRSGSEYRNLLNEYNDEIERLEMYGLVETESDDSNTKYRVKITNRGLTYFNFIKTGG